MNALSTFAGLEVWHIAGWTMLHFLWLGTLVGLAAFAFRQLLRRAMPNIRYAVALSSLLLLAVLPFAIAAWLIDNSPRLLKNTQQVATPDDTHPEIIELNPQQSPSIAIATPASRGVPAPVFPAPTLQDPPTSLAALESCVPYLPWLWIIGTPLTFALLAAGIVGTKRLRNDSRAIDDGPVLELLSRLASSLHISRRVSIAACERIASPVLIGIVRPIILLPPAALSGWSPDEIEMVLLHELAHVRRWDNLVNLMQRLVESLLFFHPAVWLVSNWVRRERETCCDAFVVRRTERPHAYAELLLSLAAVRSPLAGLAFARHPLRSRIRQILQLEDDPMLISGKSLAVTLTSLLVAATLTVLYLPTIGQADESTTEVTEDTEKTAAEERYGKPPVHVSPTDTNGAAEVSSTNTAPDNAEPQILATFPNDSFAQNNAFPEAYRKARKNNQYVDLMYRENDVALVVAGPEPNENNWPDVLGETPQKDRVIAEKAYARLGLKLAPCTNAESVYRQMKGKPLGVQIVGGNVPKGLPLPSLLTQIVGERIQNMDEMLSWLEGREGQSKSSVKCYAVADDKEYLFEAAPSEPTKVQPTKAEATRSQTDLPYYVTPSPETEAADAPKPRSRNRRVAAPGAESSPKSALRYDGKSFGTWRDTWRTELSIEKRLEAVKALAAFGGQGYGQEAAETILDVVAEYDARPLPLESSEAQLKQAVRDGLVKKIPASIWRPILRKRFDSDPEKWQWLAIATLPQIEHADDNDRKDTQSFLLLLARSEESRISSPAISALVKLDPALENNQIKQLVMERLNSDQLNIVRGIISDFSRTPQFPPELIDILLHGDAQKQKLVRRAFDRILPGNASLALVDALTALIKDETKAADHLAAIRALATLGPIAEQVESKPLDVLQAIAEDGESENQIAAAVAIHQITGGRIGDWPLLAGKLRDADGKELDSPAIQKLTQNEREEVFGKITHPLNQ